jgi:hypothetical protein
VTDEQKLAAGQKLLADYSAAAMFCQEMLRTIEANQREAREILSQLADAVENDHDPADWWKTDA